MHIFQSTARQWLPLGIAITALLFIGYIMTQQAYRSSANDPQIQLAIDTVAALNNGASPKLLEQNDHFDISTSLAPFIIIYSNTGDPVASTGLLNNVIPKPPAGVFQQVRLYGEDRLTWQPEPEVRIAAVAMRYNGGFVVVGRSLREVEKRIVSLGFMIAAGWFGTLVITLGATIFLVMYPEFRPKKSKTKRGISSSP